MGDSPSLFARRLPAREFKALVLAQVRQLLVAQPLGFRHNDLACRIGGEFANGQSDERRLRNCVDAMLAAGVLAKAARGWFVAGPNVEHDEPLGTGVELAQQLYDAFYGAGGIMTVPEILKELDRTAETQARLVRTLLAESPLYFSGVPLDGYRTHWLLIDSERKKVPIPGRWLMLDLQLMTARMGAETASWQWGLNEGLAGYRARIGRGVRDVRLLLGIEKSFLAAEAQVGSALEWCLSTADDVYIEHTKSTGASRRVSVAAWWADMSNDLGRGDALELALTAIESDDRNHQLLLHVLDVRFWKALGKLTGLDPAYLSRGALVHDDTNDLLR